MEANIAERNVANPKPLKLWPFLEVSNYKRLFVGGEIECKIQYMNRSCNMAAHKLSRNAWHVSEIVL